MRKLIITGVSIGMTVLLGSCSILPKEQSYDKVIYASAYETEYEYAYVKQGTLAQTVKVVCSYLPAGKEDYFFPTSDEKIDEIFVAKGDQVKSGDLLAQVYIDDLQAEIDEANKEVCRLTLDITYLKRAQEIEVKKQALKLEQASTYERAGMDSIEDVRRGYEEQIRTDNMRIEVISLEMKEWQRQIEEKRMYATMNGEVTYTLTLAKDTTSKVGTKVVTVADTSHEFFVAQTEYASDFIEGNQYFITVDSTEYEGEVVDPSKFQLSFEEGKVYFLINGSTSDLESNIKGTTILTIQEKENTCYVAKKAITNLNGQTVVFYLNSDGIRDYKEVTTGLETDDDIELLNGVSVGEAVILG